MIEALNYIKEPVIPQATKEGLSTGDSLFEDADVRIFYPENPLVGKEEGIHLRVESKQVPVHPKTKDEWQGWLRHWAKVIGAGKVLTEGQALPDMWQSFIGQTEYGPDEKYLVTEIVGRNPVGMSWGKTAPFPNPDYDNRSNRISQEEVDQYQKTLERYFRKEWLPALENLNLFESLPEIYPPGHEKFQFVYDRNMKLDYPWESEPMLVSDKFEILAILQPHLKTGIHLMVGVDQAPIRPWRDLTRSLQGLAAAEATAQILEENKLNGNPIAAKTSVRATGSWYGGFQKLTKDQLNDPNRKWLKRTVKGIQTPLSKDYNWETMHFHPHVYGARFPDELIRLTQRPRNENGEDWDGIVAMPQPTRDEIKRVLNKHFNQKLILAQGPIKS